jgi:ribosome-associated heat shock protein Hsp15
MDQKVRTDKWLWAVRLYKTRSLAADACEKGKVRSGDQTLKAGKQVKEGEIIIIHRGAWTQTVRVVRLTEKRMGASLVSDFIEDLTPESELEKLKMYLAARADWNPRGGAGRPTKKDRRDMDDFFEN